MARLRRTAARLAQSQRATLGATQQLDEQRALNAGLGQGMLTVAQRFVELEGGLGKLVAPQAPIGVLAPSLSASGVAQLEATQASGALTFSGGVVRRPPSMRRAGAGVLGRGRPGGVPRPASQPSIIHRA